jgi:hypothetical protein
MVLLAGIVGLATGLLGASPSMLLTELRQGPLAGVEEVVFTVRTPGNDGHWYANFGYQSGDASRPMYTENGSRLCKLNLKTGQVTDLLADATGSLRDPQVHYDGKRVLFSYRKGGTPFFHLYEMNLDGTGLRQITEGPYDDLEPIYLPDGDLLFCSSRCFRWVQCWFTQVAILHRSDSQGRNIRALSANVEQDNTPWMMPDGRVLYMRWEYVDRSRVKYHHLWTMNPDGTGQMVYYGNQHPGIVMLDAKPIPGTDKVLAVFSPGHGRKEHGGRLTVVDPNNGPDDRASARALALGQTFPRDLLEDCRDPYPLADNCVLFASGSGLYLTDGQGRTEALYRLPDSGAAWLQEPRPVLPRAGERIIPAKVNLAKETGYVVLQDILHGRSMKGVQPGEIKKLLVLETLPKPINHSGTMEPISYDGTFTLPRILGTVPVEPDGSAYIELPALRSLFFVALDANDLSVKRMQSFLTVMPGETLSCVGCHENRTETARARPSSLVAAALRRPPSRIEPIPDMPEVFDFPRDIQPILDRHCVPCHNDEKRSGKLVLTGDHGPIFSHSYVSIMSRGLVTHGRDADGNKPPRGIGSSASALMKHLVAGKCEARLSPAEISRVRLWIDSGAPYAGTYAALGSGMVGVRLDPGITNRCNSCHHKGELVGDGELAFNLTRPEKSLVLLAPLARAAGGYGQCVTAEGKPVFPDTKSPDYVGMLRTIRAAHDRLNEIKRFDMADFKPNFPYIREMKRYGILPGTFNPSRDSVDVYVTDRAYWRSLWWKPMPGVVTEKGAPIQSDVSMALRGHPGFGAE